jgi:xylulose-5-phosphate/fructose-6-phosphate phosphoketolase
METIVKIEPDIQANTALSPEEYQRINAYWRAANFLSVGQIYLHDNPCCGNR